MSSYATPAQVLAWLPVELAPEGDLERLIVRASDLIDAHVRAEYPVDTDGAPTDTGVAAVLQVATCAQIEQWCEVGEANSIDGMAGSQIAVDGYSGSRAPDLAPRAYNALKVAGLLSPVPIGRPHTPTWGWW